MFGHYRLDELIGRGGMGEVYRAYDTAKDRFVALKILSQGQAADPTYQQRFRRESQVVARLGEPHIIPIHDWGEIDGVLYLDMRLVDGKDLRAVLRDGGALSPERAVAIVEQVAAALDAAHRDGLVHRDVKPENILLSDNDFAHLVDFGIAHAGDDTRLTQAGSAIGSLAYMAPEMFENTPITAACDIYALTCVLFECLTGRVPHPASTVSSAIRAALFDAPPRVSTVKAGVPASFDTVIETGLATAPARRYATGRDLAHACRAALAGPGQVPPPVAAPPGYGAEQYQQTQIRGAALSGPDHSGLDHSGPGYFATIPPGSNPFGAQKYPTGPGAGPGTAGFGSGAPASGTTPYGPSQQFAASQGTGPYGGAPYGTGPQGTGPYVPAASPYRTGPQGYRPSGGGRDRNMLIPIIGIIAVALVGLLAVGGFLLLSKGSGDGSHEGKSTALVTTTVTPTQDTQVQTTTTDPGPPPNTSQCNSDVGVGTGTPTSCGFAVNVRAAYLAAGPKGQARVIVASSPITGDTYRMSCAPEGGIVVCRGGNNAVVHIY